MPTDALISQTLPPLINGVSRQSPLQRLSSQVEDQVNLMSDVSGKVQRRPPAEHTAVLTGSVTAVPTGGFKTHLIDRGVGQRFLVFVQDGDINVYDLSDGSEVTVNDNAAGTAGAYTYLDIDTGAGETAEDSFDLVTIADYTFVLNRRITAAMSGSADAGRENDHEALIYCKQPFNPGSTQNDITIEIAGNTRTSGGSPNNSYQLANQLYQTCVQAATTSGTDLVGRTSASFTNWNFTKPTTEENVIYAYQFQNALEEMSLTDMQGDSMADLFVTGTDGTPPSTERFSDLPPIGRDGFVIRISGADGNTDDAFYVKYIAERNVWEETVKPGLDNNFDADTLPHALVYNSGTGQFSFEPITWSARAVGDEDSAPQPSFIGKTINDIKVIENRLMLFSDENVVASEAGEFFNFWPTTVTTLVDSDPFDIAGTGDKVAIWDYAIPYKGKATLFSATGEVVSELIGSRDDRLTLQNARLAERGSWAHSKVRPIAVGDAIYFLLDRGGYTSVFRYQQTDVDVWQALDVSSHIREYLPISIYKASAGLAENYLCFLSSEADYDHRVYVYRYHFVGNEQVLASWSYWQFADDDVVLDASWVESVCYLTIARTDGIHFEKLDFGKTDEDEGAGAAPLGFRVYLDSLFSATGSYSSGTGLTTWSVPYDQADIGGNYVVVKGGAWGASAGSLLNIGQAVNGSVFTNGDHSASPVYIGRVADWTLELSEPVIRDKADSRQVARLAGRLQLRRGRIAYEDTGAFTYQIKSKEDGDTYYGAFAWSSEPTLEDGIFDFDIGGNSRDVRIIFTGDSYEPCSLLSVEWEGRFYQRSDQT